MKNIDVYLIVISIIFAVVLQFTKAQEKKQAIPELTEMHQYIRPMWHKGYAEKDYQLLKALYADLISQFEKLKNAPFPTEWPDKQRHWEAGINRMENALAQYGKAITADSADQLLAAAKNTHDEFEALMQIIHPPIPEIDEFHKILYYVYHEYLPAQDWEKVRGSIEDFEIQMAAIEKVQLPKKMNSKKDDFGAAQKDLADAVKQLSKLKNSDDTEKLAQAVEKLHEAYIQLKEVLE
jgi:hypothetical protein